MIDKNGKVFGKINIIDLIVIVVIVACIAVFGYVKLSDKKTTEAESSTEVDMQFYTDEIPGYVAKHVSVGDKLYDADANLELGVVTAVDVAPAKVYTQTDDGKVVVSDKPDYNSITITGKVKGKAGDLGVEIGTGKYGVGHSMTIRSGDAKIYLKVSDIITK